MRVETRPTTTNASGRVMRMCQSRGRIAPVRATASLNAYPAAPSTGPMSAPKTVNDSDGVRVGTV